MFTNWYLYLKLLLRLSNQKMTIIELRTAFAERIGSRNLNISTFLYHCNFDVFLFVLLTSRREIFMDILFGLRNIGKISHWIWFHIIEALHSFLFPWNFPPFSSLYIWNRTFCLLLGTDTTLILLVV